MRSESEPQKGGASMPLGSKHGRLILTLRAQRLVIEAMRISLLVGISFVIVYPLLIKLSSSLMLVSVSSRSGRKR